MIKTGCCTNTCRTYFIAPLSCVLKEAFEASLFEFRKASATLKLL